MGGLRSLDCAHSSLIPSIWIAHLPFNQWHNLFYTAYLTVNAESHYCLQTVEGYLSLIQSLRPNLLTGWWEQSWQNGRLNLGGVLFWLFPLQISMVSLSQIPFKSRSWECFRFQRVFHSINYNNRRDKPLCKLTHGKVVCRSLLYLCICGEKEPLALPPS